MKKLLRYFLFTGTIFLSLYGSAQNQPQHRDSVIQLYGVVMSADSLRGLDATSIIVKGTGRGTITNEQGVFSIPVLKGDTIRFSSIGFKDKSITIPRNLTGNQYSVIQLMVNDTAYLPATILRPKPSHTQFERDFVNTDVPAEALEIARRNNDDATRKALLRSLPADGTEA
ncbi:MAG TPA: carboxypeptidase-like regulatory domain-containing protein, partial [Chitinophagaceae bacterium]